MTPTPTQAPNWWQTLLITLANAGLGFVLNKYAGPVAAGAGMTAMTAVAHVLPSPVRK